MKFIRANINNFRLLKDIELSFSTDPNKPLTVIRAANETGKTTCETALIWGLYGSKKALPQKSGYTLFPADLKAANENSVNVRVEIDFETEIAHRSQSGVGTTETRKFRLIRSCIERIVSEDSIERSGENVQMYVVREEGLDEVPEQEIKKTIEDSLPVALKDVYFTDGDAAMSFIEAAATTGVKRKRVSSAVESLLGLGILNQAQTHTDRLAREFSGEIDDTDYASELEKMNDRISGFNEDIEDSREEKEELEAEGSELVNQLKETTKKIEEALKLGDKENLVRDLRSEKSREVKTAESVSYHLNTLSKISSSMNVSKIYLEKHAEKAIGILKNLSDKKQLPKVNIPILQELLTRDQCFCGSDLRVDSDEGHQKRLSIAEAIENSRSSDAVQEAATSLYYKVVGENFDDVSEKFSSRYNESFKAYQDTLVSLKAIEAKIKELNQTINELDDSQITAFRQIEVDLKNRAAYVTGRLGELTNQIYDAENRIQDAEDSRRKLERKVGKTNDSADKMLLARQAQQVFKTIIDKLRNEELTKVSLEMNRIFLEMIGSDPESNDLTLITKAELTRDYDIVVYGPGNRKLNPDQDLNGASRRAITLAFILALTKVSEVEAPNVIDTPLGMMAGFVKQSVLVQCVKEGTQTIMFLTHDEISGVEKIIDQFAGTIFTLTNPAHYPKMLVNQPIVNDARILRCECDHRTLCSVCERKSIGELS